jgi:hypothetical protein
MPEATTRATQQQQIAQLKKEVAAQHNEIQRLKGELATLRDTPSSPSQDFASAVQQSLDELQQRMTTMNNPLANFAVRELELDAAVFVHVTPTGAVEYRFVQPGQSIEPAALSRLTIGVVPVPKTDLRGVWTAELFQPELGVGELPEVTAAQAKKLEKAGIFSIGEFLQVATRARAQAYLATQLGVDRRKLALWAQRAALMALRGVNGGAAQVLILAELGSFETLVAATAPGIVQRYARMREKHPELKAPPVDDALAAQWVRAARQYLGLPEVGATEATRAAKEASA